MAKQDASPAARYTFEVQTLLEDDLGLSLRRDVLDTAARCAFDAGVSPEEAAIRICHEHAWRESQPWVEEGVLAPDLAELVIANRIEESARLALRTGLRIPDLLPELRDFVSLPCFSEGFREMLVSIGGWCGQPEPLWSVPVGPSESLQAAGG